MYLRMYVCMYVCMYVYMYVYACMYPVCMCFIASRAQGRYEMVSDGAGVYPW